jgi:hypothetical protein
VEETVVESIRKKYPDHHFVGEESVSMGNSEEVVTDQPTWIIDRTLSQRQSLDITNLFSSRWNHQLHCPITVRLYFYRLRCEQGSSIWNYLQSYSR